MFLSHPRLKPDAIAFRGYQANLARIAGRRDTLVVLPTGMGKTVVAVLTLADALEAGARRILVLAPTKPLVEQHGTYLEEVLAPPWNERVRVLTGHVAPAKRKDAYEGVSVVVATPQVIQNDLVADRVDPAFDWVVYDECHRAVGEYPYAFIGDTLRRRAPRHRRLGLTASPGHDVAKIDEVRHHLGLDHVEIRTPHDPDVAEYVQEVRADWETLPLPPTVDQVRRRLEDALQKRVRLLRELDVLDAAGRPTRMRLLEAGRRVQKAIAQSGDPDPSWFQALSLQAQAMKILHALEQAQTQGSAAFVAYVEQLRREADGPKASKATRQVVDDPDVLHAFHVARHDESENPKMGRVEALVREQLDRDPASKTIVFTHFRTTCEAVAQRLAALDGVHPVTFVGQGKRRGQEGLTQRQQAEVLDRFRAGTHNVLVATSVAEEGLDIPQTDLVVFYEPIPSEIRSIQRRGRTGRNREGRVVVLMTKGTSDEAAHWSSRRREQQMVKELMSLRAALAGRGDLPQGQQRLGDSAPPDDPRGRRGASGPDHPAQERAEVPASGAPGFSQGPKVICDAREQAGGVVKQLHALGCRVETRNLEVADFILSDRVAVERKTGKDFVDSLVDGRLWDQLKTLKAYPRPFLVLEGEGLQGHRNVAPEALMAALASVTVDHGIPILQTRDGLETARFLHATAKREQGREHRLLAVRPAPPRSDDEMQLFVLAGLPGVSTKRAEALLAHFGTVAAVFAAPVEELARADGMGQKTASDIRALLDRPAPTRLART